MKIKRLTQEEIDVFADKQGGNIDEMMGIIWGAKFASDFYDAQAKTMEELWEVWSDCPISENAVQFLAKKSPKMDQHEAFIYSCAVGFYLAAGGTIKDGE